MQDDKIQPEDAEIVSQVLEGNVNAFETLLERYKETLLGIVKRHVPYQEVEEVAQEASVRIYQALPGFKGKGRFRQWISAITVRTCYDFWRKAYRDREVPMSTLTERHRKWLEEALLDESEQTFYGNGAAQDAEEILDWALGQLSAKDRMILELVYLEGLSGKEAAELLGWSVANVKVRSYRSRKKLEKVLMDLKGH